MLESKKIIDVVVAPKTAFYTLDSTCAIGLALLCVASSFAIKNVSLMGN